MIGSSIAQLNQSAASASQINSSMAEQMPVSSHQDRRRAGNFADSIRAFNQAEQHQLGSGLQPNGVQAQFRGNGNSSVILQDHGEQMEDDSEIPRQVDGQHHAEDSRASQREEQSEPGSIGQRKDQQESDDEIY